MNDTLKKGTDVARTRTETIVILQDGETYSGLDQCSICIITEDEAQLLADGEIECGDLHPVAEILLKEIFS